MITGCCKNIFITVHICTVKQYTFHYTCGRSVPRSIRIMSVLVSDWSKLLATCLMRLNRDCLIHFWRSILRAAIKMIFLSIETLQKYNVVKWVIIDFSAQLNNVFIWISKVQIRFVCLFVCVTTQPQLKLNLSLNSTSIIT